MNPHHRPLAELSRRRPARIASRPSRLRWAWIPALLLVAAPRAAAQDEGDAPPPDVVDTGGPGRQPAGRSSARNRLFYLTSGKVVRGLSRRADDGGWSVKQYRQWISLPDALVESVADEKQVLAEAERLEQLMGDDPPPSMRAEHAAWLARKGLYVECLETLDRLFADEPDEPHALRFLAETPPPLSLPEIDASEGAEGRSFENYLRMASTLSTAGREIAIGELGRLEQRDVVEQVLRRELSSHQPKRRAFVCQALKRLFPGEVLEPLLSRSVLDGSEDVRREAALALRTAANPAVVTPVVRTMASSSPRVRMQAVEALGNMGYASAVAPLMSRLTAASGSWKPPASNIFVGRQKAYIQDFDVEIAQGESIADPQVNVLTEGSVLDVRVLATQQISFATETAAIRKSLARITGENPGYTTGAWTTWWEANRDVWLARAAEEAKGAQTPGAQAAPDSPAASSATPE